MPSTYFFRMGKVSGKNGILTAARHNKRTLQAELGAGAHIDARKTPLNYSLTDPATAEQVDRNAKVLMVQAGIDKTRSNQVMALEIIFSLPVDRHRQDTRHFFECCMDWTKKNIPGALLSFDAHLDESAPHAHALILPLVDNKMQGNQIMGGVGNLNRLRNLFYSEVACHFGLSKNKTKRLIGDDKADLEKQVLLRLKIDAVMKSAIWPCVRDAIHNDPLPYAQLLGIVQKPAKYKGRPFVQIMTSKGHGSNFERENAI